MKPRSVLPKEVAISKKAKVALITGITGQDGSFLAEYLLGLGYEVHGIVRKVSLEDPTRRLHRLKSVLDQVTPHAASLESHASLFGVVRKVQLDECYHLAAQSLVDYSFDDEFSTFDTNVNRTHLLLSYIRELVPGCRFYFAVSSEMFGNARATPGTGKPRSILGPPTGFPGSPAIIAPATMEKRTGSTQAAGSRSTMNPKDAGSNL